MTHVYDSGFMKYAANSSAYAAAKVTSIVSAKLEVASVLDVGCAYGTWLRAWQANGQTDTHGIDGDYVDTGHLEIPEADFTPHDLNKVFDLGRSFDMVQSLEVGEHINPASASDFADSIMRHAGRYVLFSAAPPGQGGEFHVNEQPFEYWRDKFEQQGFVTFDWLRGQLADDPRISYWYRYNVFLYVRREHLDSLPADIRATEVPKGSALVDVSPAVFRARKAVIRLLPNRVQHEIARLKSRLLPTGRF